MILVCPVFGFEHKPLSACLQAAAFVVLQGKNL